MGVDLGPCQDPSPQHGDPDPREGRTQANCGVWLTATGRGHKDTQPPTHRTRRGDTCPAPERKLIRQHWDAASQYPDKSTQTSEDQPNNDAAHIRVYRSRQKTKPSSSLPPRPARRLRRKYAAQGGMRVTERLHGTQMLLTERLHGAHM